MNLKAVEQRTGFLLANPSQFSKTNYEIETEVLTYQEVMTLKYDVEFIRLNEHVQKIASSFFDHQLVTKVGICSAAGGWSSLGIGAIAKGASIPITSALTKQILSVAAKSFGIAGASGLVVAFAINSILQKSETDLEHYERDAILVALQMDQVLQSRRSDFHEVETRCQRLALIHHLQLTDQQQLTIDKQGREIADLKRAQQSIEGQQRDLEEIKKQLRLLNPDFQ